MRRMKHILLTFLLGGGAWFTAGAQSGTFEAARMQRDLEIMEMVLERLLNENAGPSFRLTGPSTRGVYLPEFGVLFQVPQAIAGIRYLEFHSESAGEDARPSTTRRVLTSEPGGGFENELMEFFSRYAAAIGQLRPQDRIAVCRDAGPEFSIFFKFPRAAGEQIHFSNQARLAWVRKSDVEALQTGKLNEADFRTKVNFTKPEAGAGRARQQEINMLAEVFDTAFGVRATSGIYLEGYGAVFFTSVPLLDASSPPRGWIWSEAVENDPGDENTRVSSPQALEDYLRATERAYRERAKNWQSEYEKFKDKLLVAVADQGHRLRQLRPGERVVVIADLPGAPENQPRRLVCIAPWQQIEHYFGRKISQQQLRQAITLQENH